MTVVSNHTVIRRLELPPEWREVHVPKSGSTDLRELKKLIHQDDSNIQLCIYDRGIAVTEVAASMMKDILAKGPHELNEEEVFALSEVLGSVADPNEFEYKSMRTVPLNGAQVVEVEGRWKKLGFDSYMVFVGPGGNRDVHQIYYAAPYDADKRYLTEAKDALSKIEWEGRQ